MIVLRSRLFAVVGLVFTLLAGTTATASPTSVTFEGVGPGTGNVGQYNWNSGNKTYPNLVYTPFGNGSSSANHFVSFCIERDQFIGAGQTYTSFAFASLEDSPAPGQPMSGETADALRSMWAEFRDDLDAGTAADRAAKSTAFQNAIWHMLKPSTELSMSVNETAYFGTFLNAANWRSGMANLAVMSSSSQQDQLVEFAAPTPVPEPGLLALGLLVAPAVYLRRRFAAKAG